MNKDIKVFSTPTCPYCVMAKNYLKSKNIEFENIDLTKQQKWVPRMIKKSGQMGVPQLWINDQVIIGFNVPAINQALGL
ncbi:MAG: thioredoxin family protein [Prolixibacteraceae bacterium]|nr:thioredoxin family protein [Prolixibacteraceae bacterium]